MVLRVFNGESRQILQKARLTVMDPLVMQGASCEHCSTLERMGSCFWSSLATTGESADEGMVW